MRILPIVALVSMLSLLLLVQTSLQTEISRQQKWVAKGRQYDHWHCVHYQPRKICWYRRHRPGMPDDIS